LKPDYANTHLILTGHHPMRVSDLMEMIHEIFGGRVKIEYANEPLSGHYNVTPYSYHPRLGKKMVGTLYTDMGQGLLDCLAELRSRIDVKPAAPRAVKTAQRRKKPHA
jgi:UDP-glucose 4-epimerase